MGENIFKSISDEDRELLESLLDTPEEEVENALKKANSILHGLIGRKSVENDDPTEEDEPEVEEEEPSEAYETLRNKIFDDLNVEGLQEVFKTLSNQLVALDSKIQQIEEQVAEVKQDEDEKIASKFEFPSWKTLLGASEEENEDIVERLKENLPEENLEQEPTMLDTMFWKPFLGK